MTTFWSGLSTLVCWRMVTDPLPISPWQENLTPSLLASITTVEEISMTGLFFVYHPGLGIASRGKLLTRLGQRVEISADTLELRRRHLHGSGVLSLRDGQVLLVNIHELDIILAESVCLCTLEHEVDGIG